MTPGTNSFPFYITNISGGIVPGITGGFSIVGAVGSNPITYISTTQSLSGFYITNVSVPQPGQGFLKLYNSNPGLYLAPDYFSLEVDNFSTSDVYAKLNAVGVTNLPQGSPARYTTINLNAKQDSSITETIQIPSNYLPLTGWSGFNVKVYPSTRLTSSTVPALSGTTSCSVVSVSAGLVSIAIENNLLQNLIPEGSPSTTLYADIDAVDISGRERRPVELVINLRRNF